MMCYSPLLASSGHSPLTPWSLAWSVPSPVRHLALLGADAVGQESACGICVCVWMLTVRREAGRLHQRFESSLGLEGVMWSMGRKLKLEGSAMEEDRGETTPSHT